MDPLSEVLSLLKPHGYLSGGIDAGGDWSIQFPQQNGIRCFAVISGQCWLGVEDVPDSLRLDAGDCILLPQGLQFSLASDPNLKTVDIRNILLSPLNGAIATYNGGGSCLGVSCFFELSGNHAEMLLNLLPPVVHIHDELHKATLRWSVDRMMQELRNPQPGGSLVSQQLSSMMLVQALRLYLTEGQRDGVGWLFALADKHMNAAITAMHDDPAHRWTLTELAHRAGMSRSIFALKFKETVGMTPIGYLTRWRIMLAGERLTNTDHTVSEIALSLGYESQSAFRTAFKSIMGCSPRQYSHQTQQNLTRISS